MELTLGDVERLALAHRLDEIVGLPHEQPAVIVHLGDAVDVDDVRSAVGLLPAVLIGVAPPGSSADDWHRATGASCVDTVVATVADAAELAEHVARHAAAACAVALLLRAADGRSVEAGLVAESTTYSMLQGSAELRAWLDQRGERSGADAGPSVRTTRTPGTVRITLDRPQRHNAVSTALANELAAALRDAISSPGTAVLIDGNGPSFCSGGDLDEFGRFGDPATAHAVRLARSAGHLIHRLGDRATVRLHGACVGAGIELAAFAHRVVAAADTRMWLPEVAFGLVPGAGGTVSVTRRVGRHRAVRLAISGDRLDARTALAWGLVDELE